MAHIFEFKTREEARAFVQGIEYVNDSAIQNISIIPPEGAQSQWTVVFDDADDNES